MEERGWKRVKTILDIVLSCLFFVGRSTRKLDTSRNTLQPSPLRDGKLFEPSLSWRRAGRRGNESGASHATKWYVSGPQYSSATPLSKCYFRRCIIVTGSRNEKRETWRKHSGGVRFGREIHLVDGCGVESVKVPRKTDGFFLNEISLESNRKLEKVTKLKINSLSLFVVSYVSWIL